MEIAADTTPELRGELLAAYRALAREARRELEDERKENARLRERIAELQKACAILDAPRACTCPACDGLNGVGTQTACVDCEPGTAPA